MIAISQHIDVDAHGLTKGVLGAGIIDRIDHLQRKFAGIFQSQRHNARRCPRGIERIDRIKMDEVGIRADHQTRHGFARRKEKGALIQIDIDSQGQGLVANRHGNLSVG